MLIAFHLCWLLPNWEYGPVFGRVVRSLTRGRSQHGIDNWNLQKKERENISSISPFGFSSHSRNNFSPRDRKSTYLVFAFMETSLRYWRGWICCLLLDYEDFKHIFHELSSWIWNFWSTYTYVNDETTTWIVKPPLFGVFHFVRVWIDYLVNFHVKYLLYNVQSLWLNEKWWVKCIDIKNDNAGK